MMKNAQIGQINQIIALKKILFWFDSFISRDIGGEIFKNIVESDLSKLPECHEQKIYLNNNLDFGKDSLMCEWVYAINFQTNKLMCFEGFNQNKDKEYELFKTDSDTSYYGVKLIKEFDLDNLPSEKEFVDELGKIISEEE